MKLMSHYIFEKQAWEFSIWGTRLEGRIFLLNIPLFFLFWSHINILLIQNFGNFLLKKIIAS